MISSSQIPTVIVTENKDNWFSNDLVETSGSSSLHNIFHRNGSDVQADKMSSMDEFVEQLEQENSKLQHQLNLSEELSDELQANLADARLIITEQQTQISIYQQELAFRKNNAEALKLKNLMLMKNDHGSSSEMSNRFEDMQTELENLRRFQQQAILEMKKNKSEQDYIQKHSRQGRSYVNSSENSGSDVFLSPSTEHQISIDKSQTNQLDAEKVEMMKIVKQLKDEKALLEKYTFQLVQNIVDSNPNLLEIKQSNDGKPDLRSDGEKRWYAYSMQLLSDALKNDVNRLSQLDRKILQSMRKKVVIRGTEAIACQAGSIMSMSSAGAQTKRRRIDRIRDYFRRNKK